jgi:glutamate synthase (NADPH/NADH) large chain
MEYEDLELVRNLIENHLKYTGSDVAEKILKDWSVAPNVFLKVTPREYKAILLRNKSNLKKAI